MKNDIEKMVTFTKEEIKYLVDVMVEEKGKEFLWKDSKKKIVESVFRKIMKLI